MTRLPNPHGRSTPEWIGRTPDQKVPDHVKVRVFERHGGVCHISRRKIQAGEAWELEHEKPLWKGGEHRESNFRPALVQPHKAKTKSEAKDRAKSNSVRKKHLGIHKPRHPLPHGRGSRTKQKVGGPVVDRETGEPV